jgi:hypothetical protein
MTYSNFINELKDNIKYIFKNIINELNIYSENLQQIIATNIHENSLSQDNYNDIILELILPELINEDNYGVCLNVVIKMKRNGDEMEYFQGSANLYVECNLTRGDGTLLYDLKKVFVINQQEQIISSDVNAELKEIYQFVENQKINIKEVLNKDYFRKTSN